MTDLDPTPSRMELGAAGESLESPDEFYASIVALWPHATREERRVLSTASQRIAYSHCTAEEQRAIVAVRERARL